MCIRMSFGVIYLFSIYAVLLLYCPPALFAMSDSVYLDFSMQDAPGALQATSTTPPPTSSATPPPRPSSATALAPPPPKERRTPRARRIAKQLQDTPPALLDNDAAEAGAMERVIATQDDLRLRLADLEALVGRLRLAFEWGDSGDNHNSHAQRGRSGVGSSMNISYSTRLGSSGPSRSDGNERDWRDGRNSNGRGYRGRGRQNGHHRKGDRDGRGSVPSFRTL